MNMFDDKEEDIGPGIWRKHKQVNNNRVQRASEGIKKGEPADHEKAVQRVIKFWNKFGIARWRTITGMKIYFTPDFINRQKFSGSNRDYYGHTPDIALITEIFNYETQIYNHIPQLFIEVDGERHDNKTPKINDGVFKAYVEEEFPNVTLIRLRKDELLGQTSDVEQYLKKELKGFLK